MGNRYYPNYRTKQKKQQELFSDSFSPQYPKQKAGSPSSPLKIQHAPAKASTPSTAELTQTSFDLNDRSGTISEAVEDNGQTKPTGSGYEKGKFGYSDQDYESTKPMRPGIVDTRVIKSKGKYDVEAELAASDYPEDFVFSIPGIRNRKRKILRSRTRQN